MKGAFAFIWIALATMVAADSQPGDFWHDIDPNMRGLFDYVMPEDAITALAPRSEDGDITLESRLQQLERLVEAEVERRSEIVEEEQFVDPRTNPNSHGAALHLLGSIYTEQNNDIAGEAIWQQLLVRDDPFRPNLAALQNMAWSRFHRAQRATGMRNVGLQHPDQDKIDRLLAESEIQLRMLVPLIRWELGKDSPRAFGALMTLIKCILLQRRTDEAARMWPIGMEWLEDMSEESTEEKALKEELAAAMRQVKWEIEAVQQFEEVSILDQFPGRVTIVE